MQGDIHGVDGAERRFQDNGLSGRRRRGGAGGSGGEHAYGRSRARRVKSGRSPGRRRATVVRRRFGTHVQRSVEHTPGAGHHSQSVHGGFIWIPRKARARVFWKIGRFIPIKYVLYRLAIVY